MPFFASSLYVAARSGLRKTEPTRGASPPGRNRSRVESNARNRAALSSVCWRNVLSTTKPRAASRVAGCSAFLRLRVPKRRSAWSHVAGVPGVPTETPLVTSCGVKG